VPADDRWPLASAGGQQSQTPVFRADVEEVRVNALVANRGKPVPGLQAGNFEIWDNDVAQKVSLVTMAEAAVNVVLVLDTSGSVAGQKLMHLKAAGQALVRALRPGDTVSLVTFSERIARRAALERDQDRVLAALDGVGAGGRTALYDAVYAGLSMAAGDEGRSLLLVFSDGLDNASWLTASQLLQSLKRSSVVVYAVATPGHPTVLGEMATDTGGELLQNAADRRLAEAFVRVLEQFRGGYLLTYSPQGVARHDGWHALRVGIRGSDGRVRARTGYYSR